MHRPKTERQALARRLLGTPELPGPIDVGWVKRRYGVQGSHIKRWREEGIPAARVDDLEAALLELTTEEAAPPGGTLTRRLLIGVMALERREAISPEELDAAEMALETDVRLAAELGQSPRKSGGQAGGQVGGPGGASPGSTRRTR